MINWRIILLLMLTGIVSCNKKEIIPDTPPYIEQWWDKYFGNYTVFDTANGTTYQMEITQVSRKFENYVFSDSVEVTNYLNRFNFTLVLVENVSSTALSLGVYFPKLDHDSHQWSFSGGMQWKDAMDTLEIHATISNIAFYMDDGVPFYDCNCVDLAVKNE